MINKVKQFILNNSLFNTESKLLVAISGGADSVSMLCVLHKLGYNVELAHCNFNLRESESDEDEVFVKKLAVKFKVKLHIKSFETKKYASENKISVQMAARDLRYNWFKELLREHSLDSVVVGHHQNDDVETFLINLLRGSGIRGMLAMSAKNNNIVRPLLSVNREEIEEYLHEIKQDFREDSSNKSVKYLRNRIRLQVMPTLKDINPKINQTISDEIEILDAVFQIFQQQIDFQKQKLLSTENGVLKIRISDLVKLKPLNVYLYEFLKPFGFTEIKKLISTLSSQSGKQFFSSSHQLVIDREFVFIEELTKSSEEYIISENQVMINTPITVSFDLSKNTEITKYQKKVKLDYSKLEFPLILRKWKKGDKFIPLGMRQFKKLSNFFIDEKYSILDKQKQWLLCSANNIVWVVGVRIDDRFKIDKNTKKVYIAELLNKD